jgi:hypothetical protein
MTSKLYILLNERNAAAEGVSYRSSLTNKSRRLKIDVYDYLNPPKKYHDKRLDAGCLENIAKEIFTNIDFVCDTCVDNGVRISFKPKSVDDKSQKYFGHHICVDETSSLTIIIQTNKDVPTLPDVQRNNYAEYANRVIADYLSKGKTASKKVR